MSTPLRRAALVACWVMLMFFIGQTSVDNTMLRWITTLVATVTVAALLVRDAFRGAVLLSVWLVGVGTLRRVLTGLDGFTDSADPLLLVGPALLILSGLLALNAGALRNRTPLTTAVVFLSAVLVLSIVNPSQGGPFVGLTGFAAAAAPISGFFVGRALFSQRDLTRLLGVTAVLATVAGVYGIVQVHSGFPGWDARWIRDQGYAALFVAQGVSRPFSSFASGQAFANYVACGTIVVIAFWRRVGLAISVPALAVLLLATAYSGVRTVSVLLVIGLGLMAAARAGWGPLRALVVGGSTLLVVSFGLQLIDTAGLTDASGSLIAHQARGLSQPFGDDSTLGGHLDLARNGVTTAFRQPVGLGIGTVAASGRFGGASLNAEADIGNVGIAAGLPALAAYVGVAVAGGLTAYRLAAARRRALELALLGILVVTFQHWLTSGVAAASWLAWLALGWVDRESGHLHEPDGEPVDVAAAA